MNVGYVRVSTIQQSEEIQLQALSRYDIEETFVDKQSGKDMNRNALQQMLQFIRKGDVVYVYDFSRLARSVKDLLNIVEYMEKKNVQLISIRDNIDTKTAQGRFMMIVLGAVYQFERENMLERQREGIEIARREGKYRGRKPIEVNQRFNEEYKKYMERKINKSQMARNLEISRPTLDKLLKEKQASITL